MDFHSNYSKIITGSLPESFGQIRQEEPEILAFELEDEGEREKERNRVAPRVWPCQRQARLKTSPVAYKSGLLDY